MNTFEAIKALVDGKKIAPLKEKSYIQIINDEILYCSPQGDFSEGYFDSRLTWEEYIETALTVDEFIPGFQFLWDDNEYKKIYKEAEVVYSNKDIFVYRHCCEGNWFYYTIYKDTDFSIFLKDIKRK
jgi:hypothetical protein